MKSWNSRKALYFHTLSFALFTQITFSQIWAPALSELDIEKVRVFTDNSEAWKEKLKLIQSATQSIDMSYFIIDSDPSTARLMKAVIQKANENKNLKVRILVDYFMSELQVPFLKYIDSLPNIEVKRFGRPSDEWIRNLVALGINPKLLIRGLTTQDKALIRDSFEKSEQYPKIDEALDSLTKDMSPLEFILTALAKIKLLNFRNFEDGSGFLEYLNRTHHKLLVIDNTCFQMGGRNLSDEYHTSANDPLMKGLVPGFSKRNYAFIDLDVSACAKDSTPLTQGFEKLWLDTKKTANLDFEVQNTSPNPLTETRAISFEEFNRISEGAKHLDDSNAQEQIKFLASSRKALYLENSAITKKYIEKIEKLDRGDTLLIANAYFFISSDWWTTHQDTSLLFDLNSALIWAAARGADIRIYTNSINSTDLSIVNEFSYAEYKSLTNAGIKIFELAANQGSLHMKGAFFSYKTPQTPSEFLIGSYNLDPRSHLHDTNNALIFEISDSIEAQKALASFQSTIEITKLGVARTWVPIDEHRLNEIQVLLMQDTINKKALIQRALLRQFKSQI